MTTVGQSATAELVSAATAPASGWLARALGLAAVALALLSALVTFVVLAGLTPIAPTHEVVVSLLAANAITIFLLVLVIAREVWGVVQARRRGRAAARLHVRIVALFSVIAAVPAVLVAIVASVTLDRGLDRLFSQQTQSLIENSLIVADAYVREHAQFARADMHRHRHRAGARQDLVRSVARPVPSIPGGAGLDPRPAGGHAARQGSQRGRPGGDPVSQSFVKPSSEVLAGINDTEPQVAMFLDSNYVAAIIKLRGYNDVYLYIARLLDSRVLAQLRATQAGVAQYADLSARRIGIQIAFGLMYTVIALIVLLSAVWIGLNFANYLVAPIRRLIGAAQVVSTGNLYVQVPTRRSEGDLAQLGETFNKMTQELRTQRDDIVRARDLIDSRRRFTEAVLAGASAGVIGVDAESCINI